MDIKFDIVKKYGVISSKNDISIELNKVSWNNSVAKFDLRYWKDNEPHKGVLLSEDELNNLNKIIKSICDNDSHIEEVEPVLEQELIDDVKEENAKKEEPKNVEVDKEILEKVNKKVDKIKSKVAAKEKVKSKSKNTKKETKSVPKEKKVYANAYEKFSDMFEEYRKTQPEEMHKGFKMMHDIVINHIKDISESSEEYNSKAMRESKNSHDLMKYVQSKAFENPEILMTLEAQMNICIWVDEYIGKEDEE